MGNYQNITYLCLTFFCVLCLQSGRQWKPKLNLVMASQITSPTSAIMINYYVLFKDVANTVGRSFNKKGYKTVQRERLCVSKHEGNCYHFDLSLHKHCTNKALIKVKTY